MFLLSSAIDGAKGGEKSMDRITRDTGVVNIRDRAGNDDGGKKRAARNERYPGR